MRVLILYHPKSDHSRNVEEFVHDFMRAHPSEKLDLYSLESVEGDEKARLYDITQYPAFIAIDDSGKMIKVWQDGNLPLMNELAWYTMET